MRSLLLLAALTGCFGKTAAENTAGGDDKDGAPALGCIDDIQCVAVAPTCCDCPTYATTTDDPLYQACADVMCPPNTGTCPAVNAFCNNGVCDLLKCEPIQCPADCPGGYAPDAAGCLTCACAEPPPGGCMTDTDCVETRADCCGCAQGGMDTAVLKTDQPRYDADLMCAQVPTCPGINVCDATQGAHCISGTCVLTANALPANACGRPDLPPCPAGTQCTVNASDPANMQGVGTCEP